MGHKIIQVSHCFIPNYSKNILVSSDSLFSFEMKVNLTYHPTTVTSSLTCFRDLTLSIEQPKNHKNFGPHSMIER